MNFTAAELRAMVPRVSVASFAEIAVIQAMLREYAALKEAAEKGITMEALETALEAWRMGGPSTVMSMHAALTAVAPLLALMKVKKKRAGCMHGDGCADPDCEGSWK
jgi:hypothetical protein